MKEIYNKNGEKGRKLMNKKEKKKKREERKKTGKRGTNTKR